MTRYGRNAPPGFVEAFRRGMPAAYCLQYGDEEIAEHADIAWRRGDAIAQVELSPAAEGGSARIAVVTDDRPGLLSMLSAAISAHSLDILRARIYCRARPGAPDEAIDLFVVRRLKAAVESELHESDVVAIRESIESLLCGEADVEALAKRASPTLPPLGKPTTLVRFEDGSVSDGGDVLVVEADDHPGLLLAITSSLFRRNVRILGSDVLTVAGRARDLFHLMEADGTRLSADRKAAIVGEVANVLAQIKQTSNG
jgi:UTP:GlnB (protein PII) uridylyltransferase